MRLLILLAALLPLAWGQEDSPPFPPEEVARQLAAGKAIELVDRGFDEPVPVGLLRKGLNHPPEALSLIADPSDRQDFLIALYLVNATDRPIEGISFLAIPAARPEIRVEEEWRSIGSERLCGSSIGELETRTLAPGEAMIFMGRHPGIGDTKGELRYSIYIDGVGNVVTRAMPGRYQAQDLETADLKSVMGHFHRFPDVKRGKDPFDWAGGYTATQREALVAKLELQRMQGGFRYLREVAGRWLSHLDANQGDAECRQALRALLEREWEPEAKELRHFSQCLAILTASDAKSGLYGSPGHFPELIWISLAELMKGRSGGANQEPGAHPWGIPDEQARVSAQLALARLKAPLGAWEAKAAESYLKASWIKDRHVSDDEFRDLLKQDSPLCRGTALRVLTARGHQDEAVAWLTARHKELGRESLDLWHAARGGKPMSQGEIQLVIQLLERMPIEVLEDLGNSASYPLDNPEATRLPEDFREAARKFLEIEIAKPQVKGQVEAPAAGAKAYTFDAEDHKRQRTLYSVLTLLAHWRKPEDLDLLKKFLNHPAGHYERGLHDELLKYFDVRDFVVELLKRRGDPVPADVRLHEKP